VADRRKAPVLVISHHPGTGFRTRSLEIARGLSRTGPTYYLDWEVSPGDRLVHYGATLLRGLCRWVSTVDDRGLTLVRLPKLLITTGGDAARRFNARRLGTVLRRFSIRHVINANFYYFPLADHPGGRYIYDVVDNPVHPDPRKAEVLCSFVRREIAQADLVTCCSTGLQEELIQRFDCEARMIPNGTHPFSRPTEVDRSRLKARLGLGNEPLLVITGRFGWWSGLDLLEQAFDLLRRQPGLASTRLLIVGPGEAAEALRRRRSEDPGFIFTGAVAPEAVAAHLDLARVGVMPSKVGDFRDAAFPIKILEYTAAQLPVVATPLRELQRIALPNVSLVEEAARPWAEALARALGTGWQAEWVASLEPYRWSTISREFERLLFD